MTGPAAVPPGRPGAAQVPSTASAVSALAGITLKRLGRGKALWIGLLIVALPAVYASIVRVKRGAPSLDVVFEIFLLLLVLVPAMFVSSSIGEEIEERTSTYLWSRPIARWAVLAGKLCALAPIVIGLLVGGWCGACYLLIDALPPALSWLALAAGCLASSLVAAGVATAMPKHGMAMTVGYLLVDYGVGRLPFSLNALSITQQTRVLANLAGDPGAAGGIATPVVTLAVIAGVWSVIALARIRRLES